MDQADIQARVYAGYGRAASYVGQSYGQYRPNGAANPVGAPNLLSTLAATFTTPPSGFNFERTPAHKDTTFSGLFDAAGFEVGDYLAGAGLPTWFVGGLPPLRPPLCVLCNRVLTISAPGPSLTFGAQASYEGTDPANETPVMTAWPANVIFDARGRAHEVGLPLDLPSPFYVMLMPALAGVDVRSGMIATDDDGRRYDISGSERSGFGWRIWAQQSVT